MGNPIQLREIDQLFAGLVIGEFKPCFIYYEQWLKHFGMSDCD